MRFFLLTALLLTATAFVQIRDIKGTETGKCWNLGTGDGFSFIPCNRLSNQSFAVDHASGNTYESGVDWAWGPSVNDQQAAAPPRQPPLSSQSDFVPADHNLVWSDEFNETNLDTFKWWTRMSFSGGTLDYLNDEWERYRESGNHVMTGHSLRLTALPHNGKFWPSGMIRSKVTLPLSSGAGFYVEGRFKVLNNRGVWPAFWLAADDRGSAGLTWPPEFDIMEIPVNTTSAGSADSAWTPHTGVQTNGQSIYGATWTYTDPSFNGQLGFWNAGVDLSRDWHIWGFQYKGTNYSIWIDGKLIQSGTYKWVFADNTKASANIIANLAIGGSWAGRNGVDETKFPQYLDIDYIRVYAERDAPPLHISRVGVDLMPASGG